MLIECMTMQAAADVLLILLGAGLLPGGAFHVSGPMPPGTPVHFSFSAPPPVHLVEQLQAIPDTMIVEKEAA